SLLTQKAVITSGGRMFGTKCTTIFAARLFVVEQADRLAGLPGGDHREKKFCLCFPRSLPESKRYFALKLARLEPTSPSQITKNQLFYYQRLPRSIVAYRAQPSPLFDVWG